MAGKKQVQAVAVTGTTADTLSNVATALRMLAALVAVTIETGSAEYGDRLLTSLHRDGANVFIVLPGINGDSLVNALSEVQEGAFSVGEDTREARRQRDLETARRINAQANPFVNDPFAEDSETTATGAGFDVEAVPANPVYGD